MKDFVDLQGAGETLTKISGTSTYVLQGSPESSIRDLTVEGTNVAIRTNGADLTHVTAVVNARVDFPIGISVAGSVVMNNVTVKVNSTLATGSGIVRGIVNTDQAGLFIINSRVEINSPGTMPGARNSA